MQTRHRRRIPTAAQPRISFVELVLVIALAAACGNSESGADSDSATGGSNASGGADRSGGSAGWAASGGTTTAAAGTPSGNAGVGGAPSGGARIGAGGTPGTGGVGSGGLGGSSGSDGSGGSTGPTCGDGVCEPGEVARLCPDECALTYPAFGVDLQPGTGPIAGLRGLIWQLESTSFMTWDDALAYCSDLDLLDHTDWRLPTAAELQGIVGNCENTLDGDTLCSLCAESPLCTLWFAEDELNRWGYDQYGTCCAAAMNFETGRLSWTLYKTNMIRTRCVRTLWVCDVRECLDSEVCVDNRCVPPLP